MAKTAMLSLAALAPQVLAESTVTWAQCKCEDGYGLGCFGQGVYNTHKFETYGAYNPNLFQIISYNETDGKMKINEGAWSNVFDDDEETPINVIFLFGQARAGKSTLGSFLYQAMKTGGTHFQFRPNSARLEENGTNTRGVWASPVFTYTNINEENRSSERKYVIFDTEGMSESFDDPRTKLHMINDMVLKTQAMMAEVASVYVYVVNDNPTEPGGGFSKLDFEQIGGVMDQTRIGFIQNARREAEESGSTEWGADTEAGLSSINKPALCMVRQNSHTNEFLESQSTVYARQSGVNKSIDNFNGLGGDEEALKDALTNNFKAHQASGVPFHMSQVSYFYGYSAPFEWQHSRSGYNHDQMLYGDNSSSDAAESWRRFSSVSHECKPDQYVDFISAPFAYKVGVEHIAEQIHAYATKREVTRAQGRAMPLNQPRLKEIISRGIKQMNLVGPLPRVSLWRRVTEDRCEGELDTYIERTHGMGQGQIPKIIGNGTDGTMFSTGKLRHLSDFLAGLHAKGNTGGPEDNSAINEMKADWENEVSVSWTSRPTLEAHVDAWFAAHPLMRVSEKRCKREGLEKNDELSARFDALGQEYQALYEYRRRQKAEQLAAHLRERIDDLEADAWWAAHQWYIIAGVLGGLIFCMFFGRFCLMGTALCNSCLKCIGDFGDTKETKYIVQNDAGIAVHREQIGGNPPIARSRSAGSISGAAGTNPNGLSPHQRLDSLNEKLNAMQH